MLIDSGPLDLDQLDFWQIENLQRDYLPRMDGHVSEWAKVMSERP